VNAAFKKVSDEDIKSWVRDEPTGAFARRAWFLHEYFTGDRLDLPDAEACSYHDVQNGGTLPKSRRKLFEELTDHEVAEMKATVQRARQQDDGAD